MATQEEVAEAQRVYRTPVADLAKERGGGSITLNQTLDRAKPEKKATRPTAMEKK